MVPCSLILKDLHTFVFTGQMIMFGFDQKYVETYITCKNKDNKYKRYTENVYILI